MNEAKPIATDGPGEAFKEARPMEPQRTNLGRGLSALLGEESENYTDLDQARAAKTLPIEKLHPNPKQPRHSFPTEALQSLADSIAANGVLQPILVRRHEQRTDEYEIIAGERRWRAAQMAKVHKVPVVIREIDDGRALELALVENLQREDLTPIEEAEAYSRLMEQFGHSQDALGKAVGKSRSHIANSLRLLSLSDPIKAMIEAGTLSAGHARTLIGVEAAEALADEIVSRGLSVRETEALVRARKGETASAAPSRKAQAGKASVGKDADTLALERQLGEVLGLKVAIDVRGPEGSGSLTIHYESLEQLDDVLERLNRPSPKFS